MEKHFKFSPLFIFIIIFLVIGFSGLFFLYVPNTVVGSDDSLFVSQQLYFSEKLSYLFVNPKVGDRVIFRLSEKPDIDQIGVVIAVEGDSYSIVSRKIVKNAWIVHRSDILRRVYHPFVSY